MHLQPSTRHWREKSGRGQVADRQAGIDANRSCSLKLAGNSWRGSVGWPWSIALLRPEKCADAVKSRKVNIGSLHLRVGTDQTTRGRRRCIAFIAFSYFSL